MRILVCILPVTMLCPWRCITNGLIIRKNRGRFVTGLVNRVRGNLDDTCFSMGQMKKQKCGVRMDGMPKSRLIIDCDRPGAPFSSNATRCDYLLIAEDQHGEWIIPLELKQGTLVSKVAKQLQAGARAAEKVIPRKRAKAIRFRPVVA